MTEDYLRRPRELAITDFRFAMRVESVLVCRSGRKYLVFARTRAARPTDGSVPELTRRLVECALGTLVGGFLATTIWFGLLAPILATPLVTRATASIPATLSAQLKGYSLSTMAQR
jgi:hypothetical protein